jgi:predicted RNA-binding protein associated with RNAse of E/G family
MTAKIKIHKLDAYGRELLSYSGEFVHRTQSRVTLEAFFNHDDKELDGLSFRRGDRFIETHYGDRWYNVFAIYDVDSDRLKGWYCNITRPARIEDGQVSSDDLALDLIVYPDGTWKVLDQDEFEALDLPQEDRTKALATLAELRGLAEALEGPFQAD